jgi:hypothetical protein
MGDRLGTEETTEREVEILHATVNAMRSSVDAIRFALKVGVEETARGRFVLIEAAFMEGLAELLEAVTGYNPGGLK